MYTMCYIHYQQISHSHIKGKCPYELLYQSKPSYSHIRAFGCLCYPTLPKSQRDKFQARIAFHIYIGYLFGSKGYKIFSLATKKIHISKDIFTENVDIVNLEFGPNSTKS